MNISFDRSVVTFLFLVLFITILFPSTGWCDNDADLKEARFQWLLEIIEGSNGDGAIDADELSAFLIKNKETFVKELKKAGLEITGGDNSAFKEYLEKQAFTIQNDIDKNKSQGIDKSEYDSLMSYQLPPPFNIPFAQLLPTPPGGSNLEEPKKSNAKQLITDMKKWIGIRKSYLDSKDIGKKATFNWSHYGDEDETRSDDADQSVFDVQGALAIHPPMFAKAYPLGNYGLKLTPAAVVEADISSDSDVGRDKVIYRLGLESLLYQTGQARLDGVTAHNFWLTFNYITDRAHEVEQYGASVQYSFNYRDVGVGLYQPILKDIIYGRWRPYWGFEYASVEDPGDNDALKEFNDYANFLVRARMDLLIFNRFTISPGITLAQELMNDGDPHLFYDLEISLPLDEAEIFSVIFGYEHGEKSPDFVEQEVIRWGLGIKF